VTGRRVRSPGRVTRSLVASLLLVVAACHPSTPIAGHAAHPTRSDLIGAWHLVSIQRDTPSGRSSDPFYNEGSTGLLIYDPSGWMSVQIVGRSRAPTPIPIVRPDPTDTPATAPLRAAALDTYYAYLGTWDFDETTSTVAHHVTASLYPSEAGATYRQSISLNGDELIFTTRRTTAVGVIIQRKIWRR